MEKKTVKRIATNMIPTCSFCNSVALKTNGRSEYECANRADTGTCEGLKPRVITHPPQRRNELCKCGSGIKYKNCCINIPTKN